MKKLARLTGLFLLALPLSAPSAGAPLSAEETLFCYSTERVTGYNHVIRITFAGAEAAGGCQASGRHSFWTSSRDVRFSCDRLALPEGKEDPAFSAWRFTASANDREDLASLSFVYYPRDRRALGLARLASGVVFGVSCRK